MLRFIINGQRLSLVTGKVVSGTHNYLTAELDCHGPGWNGLRKWAHFKMGDEVHYVLPMHDDRITEEQHLDLTGGTWTVYIHGNRVEDEEVTERVTTNEVYLFVEGQFDASVFPPLTPEFEEVLAYEVEHAIDVAQSVRDDADAGEFDGATFTPDVSEDGIISWANDQGKENPEPRSIKGPKGDIGPNAVYIGHEEPTDPGYSVWVDPEGGVGKVIMSWDYVPSQIHEPHTPGTYDDYLVTFSDGTALTVSVYNGVDGEGTGDMAKSVYDTGNKATDVFTYADAAAGEVQEALDDHIEDANNPHQVTAAQVGLGNVDNTADADKPISDATQRALDEKANTDDLATVAFTGAYSDLSGRPTIDSALSSTSTNAVQNKVIAAALNQRTTVDSALSASSSNPVQNKAIKAAIDAIRDALGISGTFFRLLTTDFVGPVTASATQGWLVPMHADGYRLCAVRGIEFYADGPVEAYAKRLTLNSFYVKNANTSSEGIQIWATEKDGASFTVKIRCTALFIKDIL